MIYKDFQDLKLSNLGFGMMRLPLLSEDTGDINDKRQGVIVMEGNQCTWITQYRLLCNEYPSAKQ